MQPSIGPDWKLKKIKISHTSATGKNSPFTTCAALRLDLEQKPNAMQSWIPLSVRWKKKIMTEEKNTTPHFFFLNLGGFDHSEINSVL
jgi:hypothetical protein